jgi:hypothetical protein
MLLGGGYGARGLADRAPSPVIAEGSARSVRVTEELRSPTRLGSRSPSQAMGFLIRSGSLTSAATEEVRAVDHREQYQSAQSGRVLHWQLRVVSGALSHAHEFVNPYTLWNPRNRCLQIRHQGRPARSGAPAVTRAEREKNRPPGRRERRADHVRIRFHSCTKLRRQ